MSFLFKAIGNIVNSSYEEKKENQVNNEMDNEVDDEVENHSFLNHLLFENDKVKYYKTTAKELIDSGILIWSGQRPLNRDHIMSLARQFNREEHVIGTFKLVLSENNEIRLIDGQHRYLALKEILNLEPDFNCDIFIEIYKTDRLESNNTYRLFQNANNVLNVKYEDMANKNALSIIDKLTTRFKPMIKDIEIGKRCSRPYINKRLLFEKLKKTFTEYDINEEFLYENILKQNENYKNNMIKIIDLAPSSIKKCIDSDCYLGFDKNFDWLDEIISNL